MYGITGYLSQCLTQNTSKKHPCKAANNFCIDPCVLQGKSLYFLAV